MQLFWGEDILLRSCTCRCLPCCRASSGLATLHQGLLVLVEALLCCPLSCKFLPSAWGHGEATVLLACCIQQESQLHATNHATKLHVLGQTYDYAVTLLAVHHYI